MASTSFDKSSAGAAGLAALLLLLVAVLAGSFAPASAQATVGLAPFKVDNLLTPDNDIICTITQPIVGSPEVFFVEAGESATEYIQPAQPVSSKFEVQVLGKLPLGGGQKYCTGADTLQRGASLLGYRFEVAGPCTENNKTGLMLKGYTMPVVAGGVSAFINSTCAPRRNDCTCSP